jgi:hypothetical protein
MVSIGSGFRRLHPGYSPLTIARFYDLALARTRPIQGAFALIESHRGMWTEK